MLRYSRILQEVCRNDAVGRIRVGLDDVVDSGPTLRCFLVEDVERYPHTNFGWILSIRLASRASGSCYIEVY